MISFIAAVYNEENEITTLLNHIIPYVDFISITDDQSTDSTYELATRFLKGNIPHKVNVLEHTGLPETVKNDALKMVPDGSWVLMLDADERFITPLQTIRDWIQSPESEKVDYVYFNQYEVIDRQVVRNFQKCKLFRKEAITFPLDNIHADDQFTGNGEFFGWEVTHRKTSYKQIKREEEYLATYQKLFEEGKIDEGRLKWLQGLHHFVKP